MQHCCQASHYTFDIFKCGKELRDLCKLVRLLCNAFMQLKHIPFPVLGKEEHYLSFSDVFGTEIKTSPFS